MGKDFTTSLGKPLTVTGWEKNIFYGKTIHFSREMLVEKIQVFTLEIREHSKNMQRRPYKATCFLQECIKKKII